MLCPVLPPGCSGVVWVAHEGHTLSAGCGLMPAAPREAFPFYSDHLPVSRREFGSCSPCLVWRPGRWLSYLLTGLWRMHIWQGNILELVKTKKTIYWKSRKCSWDLNYCSLMESLPRRVQQERGLLSHLGPKGGSAIYHPWAGLLFYK
jgi:hypothetical protein